MSEMNLNAVLGPQFKITLLQEGLTLNVGAAGASGVIAGTPSNVTVSVIAQTSLNAYRAVGYDGLFTENTQNSLSNYAGITTKVISTGESGNVVRFGSVSESNWNWTPNQSIFISSNGMLTQNPPSSGPIRRIGWAVTSTKVNFDPYPIITGV